MWRCGASAIATPSKIIAAQKSCALRNRVPSQSHSINAPNGAARHCVNKMVSRGPMRVSARNSAMSPSPNPTTPLTKKLQNDFPPATPCPKQCAQAASKVRDMSIRPKFAKPPPTSRDERAANTTENAQHAAVRKEGNIRNDQCDSRDLLIGHFAPRLADQLRVSLARAIAEMILDAAFRAERVVDRIQPEARREGAPLVVVEKRPVQVADQRHAVVNDLRHFMHVQPQKLAARDAVTAMRVLVVPFAAKRNSIFRDEH